MDVDIVIFVFIVCICFWQGAKAYNAEEQNKVFSKYPIRVSDVKQYNHQCGMLIMGFGVVAGGTFLMMMVFGGWVNLVLMAAIFLEAFVTIRIYKVIEKKFRIK